MHRNSRSLLLKKQLDKKQPKSATKPTVALVGAHELNSKKRPRSGTTTDRPAKRRHNSWSENSDGYNSPSDSESEYSGINVVKRVSKSHSRISNLPKSSGSLLSSLNDGVGGFEPPRNEVDLSAPLCRGHPRATPSATPLESLPSIPPPSSPTPARPNYRQNFASLSSPTRLRRSTWEASSHLCAPSREFRNQRTPSPPESLPQAINSPTRIFDSPVRSEPETNLISTEVGACLGQKQQVGFHNPRFVCYANASMVALLKLPWITRAVMAKSVVKSIQDHPDADAVRTARAFLDVVRAASRTNKWNTISLKPLRASLGCDMENDNIQQDAHEFTTFLMGAFAQNFEETELFQRVAKAKGGSGKLRPSTTPCPFGRVLESVAFNKGVCLGCKQEYEVRGESYYNLVAHFPGRSGAAVPTPTAGAYHLSELMKTGVETVVDYTCEKCGHGKRTQVHRFRALPRVLSVSINRGDKGQAKHHDRVKIPEVLDMSSFCLPDASMPPSLSKDEESELPQPPLGNVAEWEHINRGRKPENRFTYHLAAIVNHSGSSARSGHYVAFVRQPESADAPWSLGGTWTKYDDRFIKEQRWSEVEDQISREAALVYYVASSVVDQGPNPSSEMEISDSTDSDVEIVEGGI